MRILVSNDDGINAPGLAVLERIAAELSDDVWVVAPEFEQSGASHSLTLSEPLRLREITPRRFAVRGTPTDCVMLAISRVLADGRPDLVLSGVNRGGNLGEDVTYSGTIAAAMEGTLMQVPSIALSQVHPPGGPSPWDTAAHHGPKVINRLLAAGWPSDVLININFPDAPADAVTGVEIATQGRREANNVYIEERIDARNVPYYWIGFRRESGGFHPDSDLAIVARGAIAVTPLHLDLAHRPAMEQLKVALAL